MIANPYKIQYLEANKNFSFRPINQIKKENIKLKPFVTDKTRVEKYLKTHQEEHEKYKKLKKNNFMSIDDNNNNNNNTNYNLTTNNNQNDQRCCSENNLKNRTNSFSSTNMEKYLQPIMKFKPRTDLERIFDSINLNYYGKIDRNVINEQLKSLGLVTVYSRKNPNLQDEYSLLREKLKVNPEILNYLIKEKHRLEKGPKTKEIEEVISNMENIININKGILSDVKKKKSYSTYSQKSKDFRNKRRNMKNFLAKNILSEYQKKTHFKALCTCSLEISDPLKKKSMNLENNKDYINKSEDKYYSYNTLYNSRMKDNNDTVNNWKCSSINLCKKQFHKKKQYSTQELDYLKNLFTRQIDTRSPFGGSIFDSHKKIYEEENEATKYMRQANIISINGKYYNKNDIKGMSNAVLKECNFIRKCFEAENAGEGKTMITRGMTVNEFTKKYGLPK